MKTLIFVLLFLTIGFALEDQDMLKKFANADCISCIDNKLSLASCKETGWIRVIQRSSISIVSEGETYLDSIPCSYEDLPNSTHKSHLEVLTIFFVLTLLSTAFLLIRRRQYFSKRSYHNTYGI